MCVTRLKVALRHSNLCGQNTRIVDCVCCCTAPIPSPLLRSIFDNLRMTIGCKATHLQLPF
jgi:hypothetical protein